MLIDDCMNPNQKGVFSERTLRAGTCLSDLQRDDFETAAAYVGVVDGEGRQIGAIQTERLRFLAEKASSFSFVQVLDHLNIGVIIIDVDSRIFYVNSAYSEILGVFQGKIIGRYLDKIERDALLLQTLRERRPLTNDKQLIKTVNKYVAVKTFPLYRKGEFTGAFSMFTDITQLHELSNQVRRFSQEAEEYRSQVMQGQYFREHHIVGESSVFTNCMEKAMRVAKTDATVLIRGENGTGKEVVASTIRENSLRQDRPYIRVNCAAIPESLMESELFGYEEGAFTGARKGGRAGKFELADGGTLFLDEVGDISLPMQAKLLRVLQEQEVERVGGTKTIPVNVRLIAATNQPLEDMVRDGRFRMDLYYRLRVVTLEVPPLRERERDILGLADEFLRDVNEKYRTEKRISREAYRVMMAYAWPGNVRELKNCIESAVVLSVHDDIEPEDLPIAVPNVEFREGGGESGKVSGEKAVPSEKGLYPEKQLPAAGLREAMAEYEKYLLKTALEETGGNRERAAKRLALPRRTFFRKIAEYKLV